MAIEPAILDLLFDFLTFSCFA